MAIPKVVSLRFVGSDGKPVGYLMVDTDDLAQAKTIARQWALQNLDEPFDVIERHQGLLNPPDEALSETFAGVRVWELPF